MLIILCIIQNIVHSLTSLFGILLAAEDPKLLHANSKDCDHFMLTAKAVPRSQGISTYFSFCQGLLLKHSLHSSL